MDRLLDVIKKGGGVAIDFSQLRPKGEPLKGDHLKEALAFIDELARAVGSRK